MSYRNIKTALNRKIICNFFQFFSNIWNIFYIIHNIALNRRHLIILNILRFWRKLRFSNFDWRFFIHFSNHTCCQAIGCRWFTIREIVTIVLTFFHNFTIFIQKLIVILILWQWNWRKTAQLKSTSTSNIILILHLLPMIKTTLFFKLL